MKRWLIIALLALPCLAQTQGNIPQVKYACSEGSLAQPTGGACTIQESIVAGQTLIAFVRGPVGAVVAPTDSLGNTYACTAAVATPAPDTSVQIYACYAQSAFSGADTVTACAPSACRIAVLVSNDKVGAFDLAASTTGNSTGLYTITNSITTTTNGDLLVSGFINGGVNNHDGMLRDSFTTGAASGSSEGMGTSQQNTGAKGTYSVIADNYSESAFGTHPTAALLTLAFKPSTILLTDTAMPDAGNGVAYSAQLHGVGGTAAYTYACTGLPASGLSLNTGTGVISGATPTTGSVSIGCTVTDGILTSATDTLTITIKATLDVPIVRTVVVPTVENGATSVVAAHCGDVAVFFARGDDTHDTTGWLQTWDGVGNFVSDSFSSPVTRYVGPWGSNFQYAVSAYILGPFTQSGTNVITINQNQASGPNRPVSPIYIVSGGQAVVDSGSVTNVMTRATTSTVSASYATLVPNTLLLGAIVGSSTDPITATGTPSMSAPFSPDSVGGDSVGTSIFGHYLASTAGLVTLTNSVTGQGVNTNNVWSTMIVPIRPGIAAAACHVFVGAGEKIKRQIF